MRAPLLDRLKSLLGASPPAASVPVAPPSDQICRVCGHLGWNDRKVLSADLIAEWELTPEQTAYVDRQQGTCCNACGANLRSMALAQAIKTHLGQAGTLTEALAARPDLTILEINEAGSLTPQLRTHPGYRFGAYPELDMEKMTFAAGSFDLVIHSDTLEHVHDPLAALKECRRVLAPGGACLFTAPIIVERQSRRRDGMAPSYHGDPNNPTQDLIVWTEYGADIWTQVAEAGFTDIRMSLVDYPSAVAIAASA